MKARPIIILMLFAASILVLAWLFHATSRGDRTKKESPWQETIADLTKVSSAKHVMSAQYGHFATIAEQEQEPQAARLFRAMALSEGIQENNCAKALVRLGGTYAPPSKVVVFRGTTAQNLARSIDFERRRLTESKGSEIDRSLDAGNRYAAKVLIWSAAGDLKHVWLMERLGGMRSEQPTFDYAVCPSCGNMYDSRYCDCYCPFCMTHHTDFVWFR